jgi:hypothetical protein
LIGISYCAPRPTVCQVLLRIRIGLISVDQTIQLDDGLLKGGERRRDLGSIAAGIAMGIPGASVLFSIASIRPAKAASGCKQAHVGFRRG